MKVRLDRWEQERRNWNSIDLDVIEAGREALGEATTVSGPEQSQERVKEWEAPKRRGTRN